MVSGHLDVVGTDASGLDSLSAVWRHRLLEVDWVAAPSRFHADLTSAWAAVARPPRLLATDRPDALLPPLRDLLEAGQQGVLLANHQANRMS